MSPSSRSDNESVSELKLDLVVNARLARMTTVSRPRERKGKRAMLMVQSNTALTLFTVTTPSGPTRPSTRVVTLPTFELRNDSSSPFRRICLLSMLPLCCVVV